MSTTKGYKDIYNYLVKEYDSNSRFTIEDISVSTGLKTSTIKVYIRNKLINIYLKKSDDKEYEALSSIKNISESDFILYCSQREIFTKAKESIDVNLINNSIYSMLAAIEIHNKPLIQYRYQNVTILIINSWELALKSYITKNMKEVKIVYDDGTTKQFKECMNCVVEHIGKDLYVLRENLNTIYKYRCNYIHFYHEGMDLLLLSLIQKSILLYVDFIEKYLDKKIDTSTSFYILPIGFKKPISPIDYITNKSYTETSPVEIKDFILEISKSTEKLKDEGIGDPIFVPYAISCRNESRLKNADIVAAINQNKNLSISLKEEIIFTDDPNAKKVRIEEESVIDKLFPLTYKDVVDRCKETIEYFCQGKVFYEIMRGIKKNPNYHYERRLNPKNPKSSKQDFYSESVIDQIVSNYNQYMKNEISKYV